MEESESTAAAASDDVFSFRNTLTSNAVLPKGLRLLGDAKTIDEGLLLTGEGAETGALTIPVSVAPQEFTAEFELFANRKNIFFFFFFIFIFIFIFHSLCLF